MTFIEILILMLVISSASIISFTIGAKIGQKVVHDEPIRINPVKEIKEVVEESKNKKEIEEEERKMQIILDNIDNYDGTSLKQKEVK